MSSGISSEDEKKQLYCLDEVAGDVFAASDVTDKTKRSTQKQSIRSKSFSRLERILFSNAHGEIAGTKWRVSQWNSII